MTGFLSQPLPREDFSGKVTEYDIFLDNGQKLKTCAAECIQCSVQLPAEVSSLSISAVTTYGKSPPADVILRQSGIAILHTEDLNKSTVKLWRK